MYLRPRSCPTRSYVSYDSKLKGAVKFIHQISIRCLCEEIFKDLSDSEVRARVSAKFKDLLGKNDVDKVNNIGVLWIYEN